MQSHALSASVACITLAFFIMCTAQVESRMQVQYLDRSVGEVRGALEKEYNNLQVCILPMQPNSSFHPAAQCSGTRDEPEQVLSTHNFTEGYMSLAFLSMQSLQSSVSPLCHAACSSMLCPLYLAQPYLAFAFKFAYRLAVCTCQNIQAAMSCIPHPVPRMALYAVCNSSEEGSDQAPASALVQIQGVSPQAADTALRNQHTRPDHSDPGNRCDTGL